MHTLLIVIGIVIFVILQFNLSIYFYHGNENFSWKDTGIVSVIFFPISWLFFIYHVCYRWYWGKPIFEAGTYWEQYRESCAKAKRGRREAKKLRLQRKIDRHNKIKQYFEEQL